MSTSQKAHLDALTRQTYSPVSNEKFVEIGDATLFGIVAFFVLMLIFAVTGIQGAITFVVSYLVAYGGVQLLINIIRVWFVDHNDYMIKDKQ